MKLSWTEHRTNEEVLEMVETEREIMDTIGITLSHDMSWQAHIDAIITKASSRLYFLKIL